MPKDNRSYMSNLSDVEIYQDDIHIPWGLYLFVVVFAVLFLVIGLYTLFVIIEFNKRIMKHKPVLLLVIYIEIATLLESVSLISQPFKVHGRSQFLQRGYEPFVVNSYCLLQMIFLRITRLDIKPIRFNGIKCVVVTTVLMTASQLVTDVLRNFVSLSLDAIDLSGIAFVLYGLYLNFSFVISAPKLGKYTRETRLARKDISIQSISKRLDTASENSSAHTSLRIKTPRIRYSGNMVKLINDPDSSDSNNEVIANKQKRFSDSDIKLYLGASKTQLDNRRKSAESQRERIADKLERYKTSADWSSDSMDEYYSVTSYKESPLFSFRKRCTNSAHVSKDDVRSHRKRSACGSADLSTLAVNFDPASSHHLYIQDGQGIARLSMSDAHSVLTSENSSPSSCRSDATACEVKKKPIRVAKPKKIMDSGYIADCELLSMASEANERRKSSLSQANESPFGMHLPYSSSFLSLYRLHQARILKSLMKITYILTVIVLILCVFRIYLMFARGIGSSSVPRPYGSQWYAFQSVERILQLLLLTPTTIAVHIVIRHRFQRKRKIPRSKTQTVFT